MARIQQRKFSARSRLPSDLILDYRDRGRE
jgi:hypothetical protein